MFKLYSLAKNIIASNFVCLKFPYKLTFIVTYRCNLNCQMCKIWQRRAYPELSLSEIEKFFEKSNRFNWVNISGGEIFLRDDLVDIVKIISSSCRSLYMLDFPTNGFLPERIADDVGRIMKIKGLPRRIFVTVSLDGPQELHNKLRGHPDSWNNALKTFHKLRKMNDRRLNVFFGMTISSSNVDKVDETIDTLRREIPKMSYRDLHINLLHHSPHYYQNDSLGMADNDSLKRQLSVSLKKRMFAFMPVEYLERRYQKLAKKFIDTGNSPLPCKAMCSSCFIDPKGEVFPCSVMGKNIGNIKDYGYDLSTLWASEEGCDLRKGIEEGRCPQCWTPCEAYQTILGNLF